MAAVGSTLCLGIDPDPESRRKKELAAEKFVVEDLVAEGFPRELIERVAHEKLLGFDYRAQRVIEPQFGVMEVRRIEVKGYSVGNPIQLEHSEWTRAQHLGDTYWLYIVWNPLQPDARLVQPADGEDALGDLRQDVHDAGPP